MDNTWNIHIVSILLYGCTTWTLTKRLEKKLNGNYTRMLRAILNKSWRQHPTRHQLYGHLPPITKTIQVRRTRYAGHCWGSRDELISDVLLWTPTYDQAKAGRPARTYIQQLCEDTGCSPEDMQEAMNDREKWRERVRDIRASDTTWWWWWWWLRHDSNKGFSLKLLKGYHVPQKTSEEGRRMQQPKRYVSSNQDEYSSPQWIKNNKTNIFIFKRELLNKISFFSSSSSSRAISTDLPDPIPPPFSIVHRFQYVFKA